VDTSVPLVTVVGLLWVLLWAAVCMLWLLHRLTRRFADEVIALRYARLQGTPDLDAAVLDLARRLHGLGQP
jgi:hypothetical protein